MTEEGDRAAPRDGAGCLVTGASFLFVAIIGWIAAITLYGLVVEQWELVRVRREFGYDWAFVYAPLFAIGAGGAVAFWVSGRGSSARLTLMVMLAGLAALLAGLALFGLGAVI
ncbi:hypothetical protein [Sphingopyxis sp. KK2]|uniref:hypothetical protein n=1 Tax=Sphingopyxis sp. KK2 TaxID=1855727 RepID=UPI00097E70D2|nr:hypothetical protein [Sphingopyxis sp. KK2]